MRRSAGAGRADCRPRRGRRGDREPRRGAVPMMPSPQNAGYQRDKWHLPPGIAARSVPAICGKAHQWNSAAIFDKGSASPCATIAIISPARLPSNADRADVMDFQDHPRPNGDEREVAAELERVAEALLGMKQQRSFAGIGSPRQPGCGKPRSHLLRLSPCAIHIPPSLRRNCRLAAAVSPGSDVPQHGRAGAAPLRADGISRQHLRRGSWPGSRGRMQAAHMRLRL